MPLLISTLVESLDLANEAKPFAFFGHSLGALLAYETARYCQSKNWPLPKHLFVSGCTAPQDRRPARNLHKLGDDELIGSLREYNGTPPEILENRELMEILLPMIRADFQLAEEYRPSHGPALPLGITALFGTRDEHVSHEEVKNWAKETAGEFDVRAFEGDHFFINGAAGEVLQCLSEKIRSLQ